MAVDDLSYGKALRAGVVLADVNEATLKITGVSG